VKVLLLVAWGLVTLDAIFVVVMTITAGSSGQDAAGRGMASGLAFVAATVLAAMSALLIVSSKYGSVAGVVLAMMLLAFPLILTGGPAIGQILDQARQRREAASRGRFASPQLTAIARTIMSDDMPSLTALLREHPGLEDRDEAGETLLALAVDRALEKRISIEPARALLDAGALPDKQMLFRVFASIGPDSDKLFKLLLDKRADPNARDGYGVPICHHAKGQLLKLKLLIDSGADVDATSGYHYQNGWTAAMALAMEEAYDEALYIVQRGADVHYAAPDGSTLSTVLERRRAIAESSKSTLPESYKSLAKVVDIRRPMEYK
jgi:hypothetical protein